MATDYILVYVIRGSHVVSAKIYTFRDIMPS
jgi:hypothetical protein